MRASRDECGFDAFLFVVICEIVIDFGSTFIQSGNDDLEIKVMP